MAEPLISILIPCYNAEQFVAEAVESALGQTYGNVEVIVVDDGSSDGSVEVLKKFGSRIKLETGPNRGACAARNRAFELSSGEYIQFLDADDKLDSRKIETQILLLQDSEHDIALCQIGLFGDEKGARSEKKLHPVPTGDPIFYFSNFPIQTAAPLYRREWFEKAGRFLENLNRGQEYEFHLRLGSLNPRIKMVDEILVWVRMHDGERITNRPHDPSEAVWWIINVADFIEKNQAWTSERRELIASRLLQAARSAYAQGDLSRGVLGIERAVQIFPGVVSEDRIIRRTLSALLGPIKTERIVSTARRVLGRTR